MSKKLTLSLDENTINEAKVIAKAHHTSLSKLAENYFASLIHPTAAPLSSPVQKLLGSLKSPKNIPDDAQLTKALTKKYL